MSSFIKNKWFLLGLFLKLCLMPFFASPYFSDLFIPFLDYFSKNILSNPWAHFGPDHFPYGSALLIITTLPKILVNFLTPLDFSGTHSVNLFLYKVPLLICDILLFKVLNMMTIFKLKKSLLFFYWLNPILIYISYIHGQLDLVSIQMLLLSLYLLTRQRWMASSFVFSIALLCKFQVIIILPLMLAYIWNRLFFPDSLKKICLFFSLLTIVSLAGFYPHIASGYFSYVTTSSPQAQSVFGGHVSYGQNKVLFIGILLLFLGTLRVIFATSMSTTGLFFGAGFLLNILMISSSFAPGWFFWIIPFYALGYSINKSLPRGLLVLFTFSYFIYFGLPELNIQGLWNHESVLTSISFTLLQSFLILFVIMFYLTFIKQELPIKRRTVPIMIGISGDSGSGKNYLSEIQAKLFPSRSKVIEGDDYHKWERGNLNWEKFTHLNPRANHLHLMAEHAGQLIGGSAIFNRHYNHQTGEFSEEREITPAQIIFFQGLHTLYLKKSREYFDIKIYCCPDPTLKFYWKLKRDTIERGHSIEKVLSSFEKRQMDSKEHIETQLQYADWIVEVSSLVPLTKDMILNDEVQGPLKLKFRHLLWNDAPVFELSDYFSNKVDNLAYSISLSTIDTERLVLEFHGEITKEEVREAAMNLFPEIRSLTRSRKEPSWLPGNDGITQLITISLLSRNKG